MSTLKAVAYISRAKKSFDQTQIDHLLDESRRFNAEKKVTGVLLYNASFFFQYFEGGVEEVETVYERILKSSSHEILFEVFNDTINKQHFPDWCMGFCSSPYGFLQKLSQEKWFSILPSVEAKQDESHVFSMIMTFWNNMNAIPNSRAR